MWVWDVEEDVRRSLVGLPKLGAWRGGQLMQARITWATIVKTAVERRRDVS